jgi:hypothetical protein
MFHTVYIKSKHGVRINYRRISLRRNLSRKGRKIVKFVSITHSERNIWNGPIVANAISRETRITALEGNGFAQYPDNLYAPCIMYCITYFTFILFERFFKKTQKL